MIPPRSPLTRPHLIIVLVLALVAAPLAGCVEGTLDPASTSSPADDVVDAPVTRPSTTFYDREGAPNTHYHQETNAPFHSLEEVTERILGFETRRPDLVNVTVIGESIEGRPLYLVTVTNESAPGPKMTPLIDGGHHANEIAGVEMSLYLIDVLLENHDTNATIEALLRNVELHTIPLVNPDGYVRQQRGNALGVNLNRNYDIDWGNPAGANNRVMGTIAHETGEPMPSVPIVLENAGDEPFSEPEAQAVRDHMEALGRDMSWYLSYHTPTHALIAPWAAQDPPFQMPEDERRVHERVLEWTRGNTEYEAGKAQWGNFSAGLPYSASGSSMDWAYMRHNAPSFTLEIEFWYTSITSDGYVDRAVRDDYEGLEYWMEASLPIPMFLLVNTDHLHAWADPVEEPPLPEGVPPAPDR